MTAGQAPTTRQILCRRGLLVSVEGLNGVGKTHLTAQLVRRWPTTGPDQPLLLEEFSQRSGSAHPDLGVELLQALKQAAAGDALLRGGRPMTETMLLLAIKMHDYESSRAALGQGRLVLEGRSVHSVAVYQSLILHPGSDDEALQQARRILEQAAAWRPLPDLVILVTDVVQAALCRAELRDGRRFSDDELRLHRRAARLFHQLAADDPHRIAQLDRRTLSQEDAVTRMDSWIRDRQTLIPCAVEPWSLETTRVLCQQACRLALLPAAS